jgi:NAD(P)H-quinone oxidoreductase subunit 5
MVWNIVSSVNITMPLIRIQMAKSSLVMRLLWQKIEKWNFIMSFTGISRLFTVDNLAITMVTWVGFLGSIIYFFSKRYMKGDGEYSQFFRQFWLVMTSFVAFILSNHLGILLLSCLICYWSFYRWLAYKTTWHAAVASSRLALTHWMSGLLCTSLGSILLYLGTRDFFIQNIIQNPNGSWYTHGALSLFFLGGLVQSGTWPFHRWIISCQNAPTPILAILHGMVLNTPVYLFIRLSPLYASAPKILNIVFVLGLSSALLGFFYSRIQSDVKRNLAFSTICHMGLVWMQCGLGLFAPALAYFFWHGLFKTSLFLASGGAAQEIRVIQPRKVFGVSGILSMLCGGLGAYTYAWMANISWIALDTRLWIVLMILMSTAHLSLGIIKESPFKQLPMAIVVSLILPILYAVNIDFFNGILPGVSTVGSQPLTILHVMGFTILIGSWIGMSWIQCMLAKETCPNWILRLYIRSLNASQPHPKTVTSYRKGYDYV